MLAFYLALVEDEAARERFAQFYTRYFPRLHAVALRVLHTPEGAEDAVQAAMLKILNGHMEDFLKISSKSWDETLRWAVIIVRRVALTMRRQEARTSPLDGWGELPAPPGAEDDDARRRVRALIRTLPETYRAVLELRLLLEWDNVSIARLLGVAPSTVATRFRRGRLMLAELLERKGYGHDG